MDDIYLSRWSSLVKIFHHKHKYLIKKFPKIKEQMIAVKSLKSMSPPPLPPNGSEDPVGQTYKHLSEIPQNPIWSK